jgi:hypothetical protein
LAAFTGDCRWSCHPRGGELGSAYGGIDAGCPSQADPNGTISSIPTQPSSYSACDQQWTLIEADRPETAVTDIHIIPAVTLSKLKKRAKEIQRSTQQPHHEVLDQLARERRLPNWHHLTLHAEETVLAETAFRSGVVIGIDLKEAMDSGDGDENFRLDERVGFFCRPGLIEFLLKTWKEDGTRDARTEPRDEVEELREAEDYADNQTVYYRYVGKKPVRNVYEAFTLAASMNYFPPDFVWLKGKLFEHPDEHEE